MRGPFLGSVCVGCLLALGAAAPPQKEGRFVCSGTASGVVSPIESLATLLRAPAEHLAEVNIAHMNLLCAEGLPGVASISLSRTTITVETWAQRAQTETARHLYRFRKNPAEFENSEGFFRMLMLTVVLTEDFGVHYKESVRLAPEAARAGDGFFADAADVFCLIRQVCVWTRGGRRV